MFIIVLSLLLLPSFSLADTFVVTNLNDPGAGSLRRAIIDSNLNPGQDEIIFKEGLSGTIFLNLGPMSIQDNLVLKGPGANIITIDANNLSPIFEINDFDDEVNSIVKIIGLRFINGDGGINNYSENLTVENCQFLNGNASSTGGAIFNLKILTVDSCYFENNSAPSGGGAIKNDDRDAILIVRNSIFLNNSSPIGGGAIANVGIIELIANSTFANNYVFNLDSMGGAIQNFLGTINDISYCTFENNNATGQGGAINNIDGLIESIINSTFNRNYASEGSAIWNNGLANISFTTITDNFTPPPPTPPPVQFQELRNIEMEKGGIVTVGNGITRLRNSILDSNSPDNCFGLLEDFGGNYSNDFSCGLTGDDSLIILGPLTDNGGPTETMNLIGGDPVNGATVNCDALDENGNPTGIPIGVDQRYFPRPFGVRCDSGAFESQPTASVTITKVTDPSSERNFRFGSGGFNPLQECPLDGGGDGVFVLSDGQSISCNVPLGNYSINEIIPQGYELLIFCLEAPDNIVINNETGDINFTIEDSESDVDCIYTNIKKGSGGGGCTLASGSNNSSFVLLLLIPALILIRRLIRKY